MSIVSGPTTLTPFQATYHWRNKNCYPWSAEWFKKELPGLSITKDGNTAEIVEVTEVEGDVDLGQRKGKLLTIYDCRITARWKGTNADGEDLSGTLVMPEVSHECLDGLTDYTFEFSPSPSTSPFHNFLLQSFPSVLIPKLNQFPKDLVAANGHPSEAASPSGSGTSTPVNTGYSPAPPGEVRQKKEETKSTGQEGKKKESLYGGTATVTVETRLQASAEDVWDLLTNEKKIPMWTRSPAKMSTSPDSEFELFGGNVIGKVISAEKNKKLVQNWQLRTPNWPADHFGTMTITLDQGSDSTLATFNLSGVPKGQEDTLQGALDTYYVRGFKQMGLGTIL